MNKPTSLEETLRRAEIKFRFEELKEKIQYRKLGNMDWKEAHWSDWKWDVYEYRIKPVEVEKEIPLICVMDLNGIIFWMNAGGRIPNNWKLVKRFVTRDKVRHAVI